MTPSGVSIIEEPSRVLALEPNQSQQWSDNRLIASEQDHPSNHFPARINSKLNMPATLNNPSVSFTLITRRYFIYISLNENLQMIQIWKQACFEADSTKRQDAQKEALRCLLVCLCVVFLHINKMDG